MGWKLSVNIVQGVFLLLSILLAAGWPIYMLLIASVIGMALIIERLLYLRSNASCPQPASGSDPRPSQWQGRRLTSSIPWSKIPRWAAYWQPVCATSIRRAK